ncbi:Phage terminase large subunit [compost metagenome]
MKLVLKLLEEKRAALVAREVYDTIRDSCFSLIEDICTDLGLDSRIRFITNLCRSDSPSGSKIIFKGMDKPSKLKSIHNVSIIGI